MAACAPPRSFYLNASLQQNVEGISVKRLYKWQWSAKKRKKSAHHQRQARRGGRRDGRCEENSEPARRERQAVGVVA
jgi:hypothetical protein